MPNQETYCVGPQYEAAVRGAQLPSNLIANCIATILSIKVNVDMSLSKRCGYSFSDLTLSSFNVVQRLSDSRHPFASIAGVLEHASSMLRPSCPENLAICKDIETYISVIANQILALVPTALGNCGPPMSPM